jgi:hypothetical protein
MNEMNELEAQLRSWAPRRPSASLERRLFARGPVAAELPPAFRLSWLAPAMGTLLLLGLFLNGRSSTAIGSSPAVPMVAMLLSNQSAADDLAASSLPRAENRLPADTYQWPVRGGATSAISPILDSRRRK